MAIWVDASYAGVHEDMKSHTGGVISFGRGALSSKSSKQKLNTKSSTEAELVGTSDYLPTAIWIKNFLDAQGYSTDDCILYQDNMSAMKLETNGRRSSGQQSRHIDIRYFFIKDRLCLEHIHLQHCPTAQMLADFLTKPLQGHLFKRLRSVIMGHQPIEYLKSFTKDVPQERVEQNINEKANMKENTKIGNTYIANPVKRASPDTQPNTNVHTQPNTNAHLLNTNLHISTQTIPITIPSIYSNGVRFQRKVANLFPPIM